MAKNKNIDSKGKTTTDHEEIKAWAEKRDGKPAMVRGTITESEGGESGLLRFDFGDPEASLEIVEWEDFFKTFDERNLALLYQEQTADGEISRFFKFISRDKAEEK